MRLLLVDNYDSFTWNLAHYASSLGAQVDVLRNDALDAASAGAWDRIILSPGPGLPADAGITCDIIRLHSAKVPVLGVCLGMQAIVEVFGGRLRNLSLPLHGVATEVRVIYPDPLFGPDISSFRAGHYHSWVADSEAMPDELEVTAVNEHGLIMAVRHRTHPLCGVQFHPESVLTEHGLEMIRNFLTGPGANDRLPNA